MMRIKEVTNKYRTNNKLSLFGFIVVQNYDGKNIMEKFIWTGKWFQCIRVRERKILIQYKEFSEWNYQYYWDTPEDVWCFVKLK